MLQEKIKLIDNLAKVCLIGPVNAGKSTLFNRLCGQRKAIVSKVAGTTRDRNYGIVEWNNRQFHLVDTGGLADSQVEPKDLTKQIKKQINQALKEADLVLSILDINLQPTNFDQTICQLIKKSKKTCLLVLNQADNPKKRKRLEEVNWKQFGFKGPWLVSAINGSGTGDLLDEIVKLLPTNPITEEENKKLINEENKSENKRKKQTEFDEQAKAIKVNLLGKPNVGKSTLINQLVGEERMVTSSLPHTTRGPQDILIDYQGQPIVLVDTAGLRRKARISQKLEKTGVRLTLNDLMRADLCLMILDANQDISQQDKALVNRALESEIGLILIINKIDLLEDFQNDKKRLIRYYRYHLSLANFAPLIFISAKTGENVNKLFKLIIKSYQNRLKVLTTEKLKLVFEKTVQEKGFDEKIWQRVKINQQEGSLPPRFVLTVPRNYLKRRLIKKPQINIIKKAVRKAFDFSGTPIKIQLEARKK